jgi:Mn-dependent DtxR family transcriptional regulator
MVGDQMHIHESSENYLEAILALSEKGPVRSIDVAQHLSFSKPSVSRAMSLLRENGYVVMDQDGFLTLTDAGMEIASRIYERHLLLTQWLVRLGVPEDIAAQDACKIEHDLSVESFEAIRNHINSH